ncbi:three-helix bundle dimerization domain-containing protein [Agromyces allii]|uniref:Uncharacterized protein n=1 Tax=Agromyces allii TaxID=393607 RepID=A0ABP5BRN9_9MICO|nr:hypothetical protein [Agromyces allii]
MDQKKVSEENAVAEVVDRLAERFPSVEKTEITRIVADEYGAFEGRPVRDFVPVLTEKGAKERVRLLVG